MAQIPLENLKTATPEKIWAILERSARRQEESERRYELQRKEFERKYELHRKEAERKPEEEERKYELQRKEAERKYELQRKEAEHKREEEERKYELQRKEDDRKVKEGWAELHRMFAETDRQFKETKEMFKRTDKRIGDLGNTFGDMVEHLVAPGIEKNLEETGLVFSNVSPNRKIKENGQCIAEIDLVLENSELVVAAEIKAKVTCDHIRDHLKRLEKIRRHMDGNGDRRRLYGAVASTVFSAPQKAAALKAGFYVIVQSGETMKLDMPEGYKPKPV